MGRKRKFGGFMVGFNAGYDTVGKVMQDRDMAKVANAQVEEDQGFTVEQGEQLDAIANAKDENGNAFYNVEAGEGGSYKVTPNKQTFEARGAGADLTNSEASIDQGRRYALLGVMQDKPFTEGQEDSLRTRAMAGVMSKHGDPIKAMELRRIARTNEVMEANMELARTQEARSAAEFQRKEAGWEKQDKLDDAVSGAYTAQAQAQRGLPDQQRFVENMAPVVAGKGVEQAIRAEAKANGATTDEIEAAVASYRNALGEAEAAKRGASQGELYNRLAETYGGIGQDPAKAEQFRKMADAEGITKTIDLLKRGEIDKANQVFNGAGEMRGIIRSVGRSKGGEDVIAQVLDPYSGKMSYVNVSEIERNMMDQKDRMVLTKAEADMRNDAARTAASVAASGASVQASRAALGDRETARAEKDATAAAAVAAYKENNPGASAATLEAVRRGIIKAVPDVKSDFAPVKDMMGNVTALIDEKTGAVHQIDPETGEFKTPVKVRGGAAPSGPAAGTRRTINGQLAEWDGRGWKAVKQ